MATPAKVRRPGRHALRLCALFIVGGLSSQVLARGQVGEAAPSFELERLTGGRVQSAWLRGKPTVLVVGRTQRAAPPCKEWALALIERYAATSVFQVIVVEKAWFIPKSLVRAKVRGFVPAALHDRVLLEWNTAFADAYAVDKQDAPVVFVLDGDARIRWRYQGPMTQSALGQLARTLGSLPVVASGGHDDSGANHPQP